MPRRSSQMHPPKVFISATSGDLRSVRQVVKEALLTIHCHPVEQTNFPPDWRSVAGMLRGRMEDCQALIHLVGMRYGAEPDPATLPPGTPRRSYTQMEYDLGCEMHALRGDAGFRVYTFICPEDFPYDAGAEPEAEEKAALQRAHRTALQQGAQLRERPRQPDDVQRRILALQEQVLALKGQHVEAREEVRRTRKMLLGVLAAAVALVLAGLGGMHVLTQRGLSEVRAGQDLSVARIKTHLLEASAQKLREDVAAAEGQPKSAERERLKEAAQTAHEGRVTRIDVLAEDMARLEATPGASKETREMTRVLAEEGVDAALTYVEGRKEALLKQAEAADTAHLEQRRARLRPLLQAAGLRRAKGETEAARQMYEDLLRRDPQWPEAVLALTGLFGDQMWAFAAWGPRQGLEASLEESAKAVTYAEGLQALSLEAGGPCSLALGNALIWHGNALLQRGGAGHQEKVLAVFRRCVEVAEHGARAMPAQADATRVLAASLEQLGTFLAQRGQAGDVEAAVDHHTRALEMNQKLAQENPNALAHWSNVVLNLNTVGLLLTARGGQGDLDAALGTLRRSLELTERLWRDYPTSTVFKRDLAASLVTLGDALTARGQPEDVNVALGHFTRGNQLNEELLRELPGSPRMKTLVGGSLQRLGDLLAKRGRQGDVLEALHYQTRSLEILDSLLEGDATSAEAARHVLLALMRRGRLMGDRGLPGNAAAARADLLRAREIAERLHRESPDSAQAGKDAWVVCWRLAALAQRHGGDDAAAWWQKAYEGLQRMRDRGLFVSQEDLVTLEKLRAWLAAPVAPPAPAPAPQPGGQ